MGSERIIPIVFLARLGYMKYITQVNKIRRNVCELWLNKICKNYNTKKLIGLMIDICEN